MGRYKYHTSSTFNMHTYTCTRAETSGCLKTGLFYRGRRLLISKRPLLKWNFHYTAVYKSSLIIIIIIIAVAQQPSEASNPRYASGSVAGRVVRGQQPNGRLASTCNSQQRPSNQARLMICSPYLHVTCKRPAYE